MFHHNVKASTVRTYHCSGSEHGVVKGTGEELVVGSVDGVAALEGNNIHTYRGDWGREKVRGTTMRSSHPHPRLPPSRGKEFR